MKTLRFEWDETKCKINQRKHKISFEEARSVFADENGKLISDPEHSEDEARFILLGLSSALKLLVVCHCCRADEYTVRIISARKATPRESKAYFRG